MLKSLYHPSSDSGAAWEHRGVMGVGAYPAQNQEHFQILHLHVLLHTVWFVRLGNDNDISLDQKADQDLGKSKEEHEHWGPKNLFKHILWIFFLFFNLQFILLQP